MARLRSFKPYIFTSYYDWLVDSGYTPHLFVKTDVQGVSVPAQYIKNNAIVLSIAPAAIADYKISARGISFNAMFRGQNEFVTVPFNAMEQLLAVEDSIAVPIGQIMEALTMSENMGDEDEDDDDFVFASDDDEDASDKKNERNSPSFSIITDK